MRDQYMRCGEGFLICYSLTDRRSFEEVAGYKKLITKVRAADSIPIVLVGNKVDLDDRKVRILTFINCGILLMIKLRFCIETKIRDTITGH